MTTATKNLAKFKRISKDQIDWDQFGDDNDVLNAANTKGKSRKGIPFTVDSPKKCRLQIQGDSDASWPGNIRPQDSTILYSAEQKGPIVIKFDKSVKGVGAQIQELYGIDKLTGAPFTASIKVYKYGQDSPIATFSIPGQSDNGATKAVFLGIYATQLAEIDYVEFDTDAQDPLDPGYFAISTVLIV
jgi:hypothetical protein